MRLGNIIEFRKDLYFDGAVQADWFYDPERASKVAENFVFHGKDYFGVEAKRDSIDTISLVKALAEKIGKEGVNPRSLAIADYGTGKSHFAVTLGQLFSGPAYMPETYKTIISNIRIIDPQAAKEISSLCEDRNFVIMLNGIRDFNLHSEILKATQKSLRLYGVDDSELKKLNRTVDTANRFFELNAQSRISDFEKAASARGWMNKGESLINRIRDGIGSEDDAFEIVNDVYEMVTGQRIRWEEGISAKSILEMILSKYCGLNGDFDNVVILFDEFGRFLEYASGTDGGKSGDNALQEIFEVSQNAGGALSIINFIQTDIKTYLLRVDQSRNLSRYIGRYDESEKYHISSNLETVFANLINRKDRSEFNKIVDWQAKKEEDWKSLFKQIGRWISATGIWGNYEKFRKVVVEGIYPMHPVSVLMLTQLSDYLQNRSSMNLISQSIGEISEEDLDDNIPLVMPSELMQGDLYTEMLAAETSGRHRSDICIRFDNVLKKNEQKLNSVQIAVLRANLVTRALRFNTRTYEDACQSIMVCSGLSAEQVDDALRILVDEYAVMAFDEMSGCFDFTEDAKGAYDYKIMKRRLLSKQKTDVRALLNTASILETCGLSSNQPTNFGTAHKITTNEWGFSQQVILAEDFTPALADRYYTAWKAAKNVATPKGILIWVYVNKDSDYRLIEDIQRISSKFTGTSIVVMLLNDADNMLKNILTEYDVLEHMDETTRNAYSQIYVKDRERVVDNLNNAFEALKKKRERVTAGGTVQMGKRLPLALMDVFEEIYPEIISFHFDGLLTKANNFNGNGQKYYCQILRMLLSNKANEDTIHDASVDVRNRIEALFMTDNASSWKCLTTDCAIVPPMNAKARNIYNTVSDRIEKEESYKLNEFFDTFCAPPYGLSEEIAAMFIAVVIVNHWHNIRIEYLGNRTTVTEWRDNAVDEKKLSIKVFRESTILWVDTGSVEAKFQHIFKRINDNRDLGEANLLHTELREMISFYGLPESMAPYNQLAEIRFKAFDTAEKTWSNRIGGIEETLLVSKERHDVVKALECMEMLQNISLSSIFANGINIPDYCEGTIKKLSSEADKAVVEYFDEWLSSSVYCQSIDKMNSFERFYTGCRDKLRSYGHADLAKRVDAKGEKELRNKEEIKSRQELITDGKRYVALSQRTSKNNYIEVKRLVKEAGDLEKRFEKYGESLGKDAVKVQRDVKAAATEWRKRKKTMDDNMSQIFEIVEEANSVDAIELAKACLSTVLGYTLTEQDRSEFMKLEKLLNELTIDIQSIQSVVDREKFEQIAKKTLQKYDTEDFDYDFLPIIKECVETSRKSLDKKDTEWRAENVTLGDKSRKSVHEWKQKIEILPPFLSDDSLAAIRELDKEADKIISEGKIEDVVLYFEKLDKSERQECLKVLCSKDEASSRYSYEEKREYAKSEYSKGMELYNDEKDEALEHFKIAAENGYYRAFIMVAMIICERDLQEEHDKEILLWLERYYEECVDYIQNLEFFSSKQDLIEYFLGVFTYLIDGSPEKIKKYCMASIRHTTKQSLELKYKNLSIISAIAVGMEINGKKPGEYDSDIELAVEALRKNAELGNPVAERILDNISQDGLDTNDTSNWQVSLNNKASQYLIGLINMYGYGGDEDDKEAEEYLGEVFGTEFDYPAYKNMHFSK